MIRRMPARVLLGGRRHVQVDGLDFATLDATDTLLHLCTHAADSGGDRLLWLYDIHSAVLAEPPDWPEVVRRAQAYRVSGPVALMLARTSRAFSTPIPDDLTSRLGQRSWTVVDAAVERAVPAGSTYPSGSIVRSLARGSREQPGLAAWEVARRGAAWLGHGGPLARDAREELSLDADPGSGLYNGGGDLVDYLAAVEAETAGQ